MSSRIWYAALLASAVADLGACKALLKKKDPNPAPSATVVAAAPPVVIAPLPTTSASAVPTPAPSAVGAIDENAVPASQDFEDEAFEKVTSANFRAQFTTLKAAISK